MGTGVKEEELYWVNVGFYGRGGKKLTFACTSILTSMTTRAQITTRRPATFMRSSEFKMMKPGPASNFEGTAITNGCDVVESTLRQRETADRSVLRTSVGRVVKS